MARKKRETLTHSVTLTLEQKKQVKAYAAQLDTMENEREQVASDISELKKSINEAGFDPRALHNIVRLMREDAEQKLKRASFDDICDAYAHALGFATTPLGQAVAAMGEPVELTDEEKAKGYSAAFIGKDGMRMTIGAGVKQ